MLRTAIYLLSWTYDPGLLDHIKPATLARMSTSLRKVFLLQIWVLSVAVAAGMILKNPHDDRNNSRPSETVYLVVVSHHLIIFW